MVSFIPERQPGNRVRTGGKVVSRKLQLLGLVFWISDGFIPVGCSRSLLVNAEDGESP